MGLIVKTEVSLNPGAAFKAFNDELSLALHRLGLEFEAAINYADLQLKL